LCKFDGTVFSNGIVCEQSVVATYNRRDELVDAVQWFNPGDHDAVILRRPLGDLASHAAPVPWLEHPDGGGQLVFAGDWIVTDQFGHRYAVANPVFRTLFHGVGEGAIQTTSRSTGSRPS
jgi:hypothetical protein